MFTFRVGLAGIKGIEENQIEAHGLERRGVRIIQYLANWVSVTASPPAPPPTSTRVRVVAKSYRAPTSCAAAMVETLMRRRNASKASGDA